MSSWPCSISLYLSLPRKLIGLLDPSSPPVRLMAATWSLPGCGWWRQWDCFWFCFMPIRWAGLALLSVCFIPECGSGLVFHPPLLPPHLSLFSSPSIRPGVTFCPSSHAHHIVGVDSGLCFPLITTSSTLCTVLCPPFSLVSLPLETRDPPKDSVNVLPFHRNDSVKNPVHRQQFSINSVCPLFSAP